MAEPLFVSTFEREKTTPNTVKFHEAPTPGSPPKIGMLYIQKWVFPTTVSKVKVTVEVIE